MKLTSHSFAHEGEYIFEIDARDPSLVVGMILCVDPDDLENRAFYRVTAVGETTVTATLFSGRRP